MNAREVRAALARIGISQSEAARLMGVRVGTVQRWCSNLSTQGRQIPAPAERLLHVMERQPGIMGALEWYDPKAERSKP